MLSLGIKYFILDLICDVNYYVSRKTAMCRRLYKRKCRQCSFHHFAFVNCEFQSSSPNPKTIF